MVGNKISKDNLIHIDNFGWYFIHLTSLANTYVDDNFHYYIRVSNLKSKC